MGRAIVRNPQVFLFDEPLSNLDAKLRVQMRAEIKQLHQRLETTTIYVTHDQIEAMTMADKIVVMREGIVEQIGTPLELYDRPANLFVAGFLGSPAMNFLSGKMTSQGFVLEDGTVLPSTHRDLAATTYGIRPEDLVRDPNGIPAEVVLVEPTGAESQVILRLGEQEIVGVFKERIEARPGQQLTIAPIPRGVHLFDADGRRLPN